MEPPVKLPPKREVLDTFLVNGSARIFLDPRRDGVVVPAWYTKQPELILRVGYAINPPITDLVVSDDAVSCTLSFNRSPFWCKMPWSAVFAVVSDVDSRGVVWPDDVPLESQVPKAPPAKPARTRPKLVASPEPTPVPATAEPTRAKDEEDGAARAAASDAARAPDVSAEARADDARSASDEAGKKTKRQLPPYLRVVK